MNITTSGVKTPKIRKLENLLIGSPFIYNKRLFIKTEKIEEPTKSGDYSLYMVCICLSEGCESLITKFLPDTKVFPVKLDINVIATFEEDVG